MTDRAANTEARRAGSGAGEAMVYRKILVPLDGSPGSWKALRKAIIIAKEQSSELALLSVEEHLPRYAATVGEVDEEKERENDYFAEVQARAAALAKEQGVVLRAQTVVGHAAHTIVQYAKEQGVDLIAIGHSGQSGIWGALLGSTTARVVDQAHCDVLVVR
ncbi:MAG: universal stress protein [Chloroflexi bacterium]|nr:universal stress protein [Chloroflexota bacterium]